MYKNSYFMVEIFFSFYVIRYYKQYLILNMKMDHFTNLWETKTYLTYLKPTSYFFSRVWMCHDAWHAANWTPPRYDSSSIPENDHYTFTTKKKNKGINYLKKKHLRIWILKKIPKKCFFFLYLNVNCKNSCW